MTALLKALQGKSNESSVDSDWQKSTVRHKQVRSERASDKRQAQNGQEEKRDVAYYKTARLCWECQGGTGGWTLCMLYSYYTRYDDTRNSLYYGALQRVIWWAAEKLSVEPSAYSKKMKAECCWRTAIIRCRNVTSRSVCDLQLAWRI